MPGCECSQSEWRPRRHLVGVESVADLCAQSKDVGDGSIVTFPEGGGARANEIMFGLSGSMQWLLRNLVRCADDTRARYDAQVSRAARLNSQMK